MPRKAKQLEPPKPGMFSEKDHAEIFVFDSAMNSKGNLANQSNFVRVVSKTTKSRIRLNYYGK